MYSDYPTTQSSEPVEEYGNVEFYSNEIDFEAALRWTVGDEGSSAWVRLLYGWFILDYLYVDEADSLPRFDKNIHLDFEGNYRGLGASPWGWQARLTPGWSFGQFEPDNGHDFTVAGGLWGLRSVSDEWLLGLGVVHTYAYGSPMWLPSLLAEYYDGGKLTVQVELPHFFEATYLVSRRVDLALVGDVRGHYYGRDVSQFPEVSEPYASHSVATLALGGGFHFDDELYFRLEGGYLLERSLRLMDGTDDVTRLDPETGWFLRGVVEWGRRWRGTPRLR